MDAETAGTAFFLICIGVIIGILLAVLLVLSPIDTAKQNSSICAYADGKGWEIPACEEEK